MKRFWFLPLLALVWVFPLHAYKILYAEQWYELYHQELYQTPDACMENIYYLEQALKSDFANPLNALGRVNTRQEWALYRDLFRVHVDLALIHQYLELGSNFDKRKAYFYNYPWKSANLDSLKTAEKVYKVAFGYWDQAVFWAQKAKAYPYLQIGGLEYWSEEAWRVQTGELNYKEIIQRQLNRLESVRKKFEAMGPGTY